MYGCSDVAGWLVFAEDVRAEVFASDDPAGRMLNKYGALGRNRSNPAHPLAYGEL
ncbi:hypothetical protein AAE485_01095 [Acidithiobacillus ferriphilus]|nr:hypothetical protein [Acidithiobacillus ferriphilus]